MKKWLKWTLIIIGALVVLKIITALFGPSKDERIEEQTESINKLIDSKSYDEALVKLEKYKSSDEYYETAQSKIDSVKALKKEEDLQKMISSLNKEIESLEKGIDFKEYYSNPEKIKFGLMLFKLWAKKIVEGYDNGNDSTKVLSEKLESLVVPVQVKEFPNFRRALAEQLKTTYWEHDIKVNLKGTRSDILEFKGVAFLRNSDIKKFHDGLLSLYKDYRVSFIEYRSALRKDYVSMEVGSLADKSLDFE